MNEYHSDIVIRHINTKNKLRKITTYRSIDCPLRNKHTQINEFVEDTFMIAIDTLINRNALDAIARDWLKLVKSYMTEVKTGRSRFKEKKFDKTVFFSTRAKKSYYVITSSESFKRLLKSRQRKIVEALNDYYRYPEKYILADKDGLADIATQLEGEKKWMVKFLKEEFKTLYEEFTKLYAYEFLKQLQIRTCPYCNRNYTFTIEKHGSKGFATRADLDHFYDKSDYPLLALSFYNLVPSCHICNHGKLVAKAGINPYFGGFNTHFKAIRPVAGVPSKDVPSTEILNINEVLNAKGKDDFSIAIPGAVPDEQTNIEVFGIHELYNEHKDFVMDIIDKTNAYNAVGAQNLVDAFQGTGRSPQDVFDFVWGGDLDDTTKINHPLSKLKQDILKQIGVL